MIQSNKGSMATTRVQEAATAAEKAYQLVKRSRKGAPSICQPLRDGRFVLGFEKLKSNAEVKKCKIKTTIPPSQRPRKTWSFKSEVKDHTLLLKT